MEANKAVTIVSVLAAGAVAAAIAINWRKKKRLAGKVKKESLLKLQQLNASINHIHPQKAGSALRKKPKKQVEELVANRISGDNHGSLQDGNGAEVPSTILTSGRVVQELVNQELPAQPVMVTSAVESAPAAIVEAVVNNPAVGEGSGQQ